MNIHVLDRFDEIYYDLNQVTIEDVYIKNRDQTHIKFNSINFKNDKPKDTSFHKYFFEPFKNTQPETYKVLSKVTEEFFYAIKRSDILEILSDITAFGININGVIVI